MRVSANNTTVIYAQTHKQKILLSIFTNMWQALTNPSSRWQAKLSQQSTKPPPLNCQLSKRVIFEKSHI